MYGSIIGSLPCHLEVVTIENSIAFGCVLEGISCACLLCLPLCISDSYLSLSSSSSLSLISSILNLISGFYLASESELSAVPFLLLVGSSLIKGSLRSKGAL